MGRYYLTGDRENVQCIIHVGQSMTELHRRRAVGRMWSVRARRNVSGGGRAALEL